MWKGTLQIYKNALSFKKPSMKRILILISVLPLIVLVMASCKKKQAQEDAQITFKPFRINKEHHLKENPKKPMLRLSIELQYPDTFSNPAVLTKIRETVLADFFPDMDKDTNNPEQAIKTYIQNYINFYEDSENASEKDDNEGYENVRGDSWWDNEKMIIRNNANNILSYTIESDRFTGGAHGGRNYLNTVINLQNGERITEEDLFTEETRPLIAGILLKKIMAQHQVEKVEDLEQIGFFDASEIALNKNFYVTKKGIVYTYNEYEIAAYAIGITEVLLTYEELSGLLIPGNPIESLMP